MNLLSVEDPFIGFIIQLTQEEKETGFCAMAYRAATVRKRIVDFAATRSLTVAALYGRSVL